MVQSQAMRGPAAAIVAHERELLKSQMLHHFHLILRHGSFRIRKVVAASLGLAAVSIAAKIRHYQKIILRQRRRDLAPQHMRFRDAVKQQQRRAFGVASEYSMD